MEMINFEFDDNISQGYCSDVPQVSPDSYSFSYTINDSPQGPNIEFIEQPADYRYRYLKEKYHGHIVGVSSPATKKKDLCKFPKLKLHNCSESAVVRVWLITTEFDKPCAHFHKLARKSPKESLRLEPHDFIASESNNYEVTLDYMHIVHAVTNDENDINIYCKKKAHIESRLYEPPGLIPTSSKDEKDEIKHIDKNQSVLYIQVFDKITGNLLCDAVSRKIKNLHNAETGALKIVNCSKTYGTCKGNDEVFIFVEKISKDVEVRFFKLGADKKREWEALASFGPHNVHHQLGIVFRTPKFYQNITEDTGVFFELHRKSDGAVSKPFRYTYKPHNDYMFYGMKRPHSVISSEDELPSTVANYSSKRMKEDSIMSPDSTTALKNNDVLSVINVNNSYEPIADYNTSLLDEYLDLTDSQFISGTEKYAELEEFNDFLVGPVRFDGLPQTQGPVRFDGLPQTQGPVRFDGLPQTQAPRSNYINKHKINDHSYQSHDQNSQEKLEENNTYKSAPKDVKKKLCSEKEDLIPSIIKNRPIDEIRQILKRTENVNGVDFKGNSTLHYAAEYFPACLKLLLERDDINRKIQNLDGDDVLLHAVRSQKTESVRILFQKEFDPNIHNSRNGETPLHLAVASDNIEIVKLLLKQGANPLIDNYSDLSPYEYSVNSGEDIKRLICLKVQELFKERQLNVSNELHFENELTGRLNQLFVSAT